MIDIERQRDCFDVLRAHPLNDPQRLYVPELIPATDLHSQDVVDEWIFKVAQNWSRAHNNQEIIVHNVPDTIAGLTNDLEYIFLNVSGNGYLNEDPPLTPESFEDFFLIWPSTKRQGAPNVHVGPNNIAGYDVSIKHAVKYEFSDKPVVFDYDLNSEEVRGVDTVSGLDMLGLYVRQFHDEQVRFLAQTDTVFFSQGIEGLMIARSLPFLALSYMSFKDTLSIPGLSFSAFVDNEGRAEIVPLIAEADLKEIKPVDRIDISKVPFDLYFDDNDPAEVIGAGIIEGNIHIFDINHLDLAPNGSIVLINDESELGEVSPATLSVMLSGALVVVSRGYRGLNKEARRARNQNHSHSKIVARGLSQERPDNFIWSQLPHINPGDEEAEIWERLMSSKRAVVASDGKVLKIKAL